MSRIHLTTNVDLINYGQRIPLIAEVMQPRGIEIYLTKSAMPSYGCGDLPERRGTSSHPDPVISSIQAHLLAEALAGTGMTDIQVHYPDGVGLVGRDPRAFNMVAQFCDELKRALGPKRFTLNYHNGTRVPAEFVGVQTSETRRVYWNHANRVAGEMKSILDSMGIRLLVENNGIGYGGGTGGLLHHIKFIDIFPKDFRSKRNIDGITFDVAHAWRVAECLKLNVRYANLRWIQREYHDRGHYFLREFVRENVHLIRWLHFADEDDPWYHKGLHIGDGKVRYDKIIPFLLDSLPSEKNVVIEILNGHKPDHFIRILEEDFPRLQQIIDAHES